LPEQELTSPISVTLTLALPKLAEAEKLQQAIYTPGTPEYHQFLTAAEFASRFGPTDADVATVIAALAKYGLSARRSTTTTLKVTGMPADMERAFSVNLHNYEVAAQDSHPGYTFRAPASRPMIPAEISSAVTAVFGLDNRPVAHPAYKTSSAVQATQVGASSIRNGKTFGNLTVTDFANHYDVDPLYQLGITGSGRTMGILALAAFTPSDAFAYWAALGLNVNPNRITIVNVDGGPGAPSDASGSIETAIDVEQSGGVAPAANIIVYQAPNTSQGVVDVFAAAIGNNTADTLSTSWGLWEIFQAVSLVTDPIFGTTVSVAQATHELLVEAALQGQSVFAASGDGGAYDVNHDLGCFGPYDPSVQHSCSLTLSVDYPASDSLITAAGGTTLGGHQSYCLNPACTPPHYEVEIPQESVWGWNYLDGLCKTLGFDPISCGIFPEGTGGGVSVLFPEPSYQLGLSGIQVSQPGQTLYVQPFGLIFALPADYAGRNVPDISFNADPETGYVVYYTSDKTGFAVHPFYGGTSFVAQQLAGVTALLNQFVGKRIGFLNPTLYNLAATGQAYGGSKAPLSQITSGDNWFYSGSKGYNPATGLGTPDVANLARILGDQF
jgi:subtilase family serine protease